MLVKALVTSAQDESRLGSDSRPRTIPELTAFSDQTTASGRFLGHVYTAALEWLRPPERVLRRLRVGTYKMQSQMSHGEAMLLCFDGPTAVRLRGSGRRRRKHGVG